MVKQDYLVSLETMEVSSIIFPFFVYQSVFENKLQITCYRGNIKIVAIKMILSFFT